MRVVFCADPLAPRRPDPAFEDEVAAVERLGLTYDLVDYEALVNDNDPQQAVRRVAEQTTPVAGLYRGWMLKPECYERLFGALAARGIRLINDPRAYKHCHYLPESYAAIEGYTPRSVWTTIAPGELANPPLDRIMALLRPFGSAPIVVKDFVKSRKHEWAEACYIPSAADREAVERVVRRFIVLQGDDLNVGLVFREFVEFEPLMRHAISGTPLAREYRIFFLDGQPIYQVEQWAEGEYGGAAPPVAQFQSIAGSIQSRFFTMDVAKRLDGEWLIVELGDGQVAGLPARTDVLEFYRRLTTSWVA